MVWISENRVDLCRDPFICYPFIAFENTCWCSFCTNLLTNFFCPYFHTVSTKQVVFKRSWICREFAVQRNVRIWVFVEGSGNELQDQGAYMYMYLINKSYSIVGSSNFSETLKNLCSHCACSEILLVTRVCVDPCKWWTAGHVQVSPRYDSLFHNWWPMYQDSCL